MFFTQKRLKLYLGALLVLQIFICLSYRSAIRAGAVDYRLYYTAGAMLRTGQSHLLYDYATEQRIQSALVSPSTIALPFFAPAFAAIPFVPLSLLAFRPSLFLFAAINLTLLAGAICLMLPHLRTLSSRWRPLPALLFLTFVPVALTLMMGQLSILLLLLYCASFACLQRGRSLTAGLILSLALVKFQFAIPVALLFLLWRHWRFTLGFVCGSTLLCALSAWIIGPHSLLPYLESITHMSQLTGTQLQRTVAISPRALANLHGFILLLSPNNRIATILASIASIALIAWAATRKPSLPLALLVALLVSYHLYPCDLTLLLLPIALLCDRLLAEKPSPELTWPQSQRRAILLCAMGALLIGPIFTELTANDLIFLLALPILALAACPLDWSTLTLPRAHPTRAPQHTTALN